MAQLEMLAPQPPSAIDVVKLGVLMRAAQRVYFKERSQQALLRSKRLEADFDRAAKALGVTP